MFKLMQFGPVAILVVVCCAWETPRAQAQAPAAGMSEMSAKTQILNSPRWKQMMEEFDKWLSLQVVYSPQQVQEIKSRLSVEIQRMSSAELQQFMDQWDAKLKVLLSKDAGEAREWLGQFLSVAADGYRKKVFERLGITNISSMSAAQIEDAIQNIRAKELHLKQERTVFDEGRALQAQSVDQFRSDQRAALQRAGESQSPKFSSFQTPMSPKQYDWRPRAPLIPWGGFW
jgi:hypothetical protein